MNDGFWAYLGIIAIGMAADLAGAQEGQELSTGAETPTLQGRVSTLETEDRLKQIALKSNTVGGLPRAFVPPPATLALNLDGDLNLAGFIFKDEFPFIHTDGGAQAENTAVGFLALPNLTVHLPELFNGTRNSAVGDFALFYTSEGHDNTALGSRALLYNTTGRGNTATGSLAMYSNTYGIENTATGLASLANSYSGYRNTANGAFALYSNTRGAQNTAVGYSSLGNNKAGVHNTAVGANALEDSNSNANTAVGFDAMKFNTSGIANTAVGFAAGNQWKTGYFNIALGLGAYGVQDEARTTRIGGNNVQWTTYIEGISNGTVDGAPVCITPDDELGLCPQDLYLSSRRFKENIEGMPPQTDKLAALRPVAFEYKDGVSVESNAARHYGLVAEEVAQIFPHLIRRADNGEPLEIDYALLTPLLLDELQRQSHRLSAQSAEIRRLSRQVEQIISEGASSAGEKD